MRRPFTRFGAMLASIAAVVAMTVGAAPSPATASAWEQINGSGSTWSANAIDQWRGNVQRNYGMIVNYSGTGSTAGRTDFINNQSVFAVSEIPFQASPQDGSQPERPQRGYAYMPIVAGGTAFMYNLKISGKRVTNLRLSGEVITKIFLGQITKWNDPALQADNPGLAMPDRAIVPVVRSDGSGTSAQFTLWMSKQHGNLWTTGMTSQFPTPANGKAQRGSDGVSGYVAQDHGEGSITYVEYSYAIGEKFPVAKVLNNSGYYIEPTAPSVAVALMRAQINNDSGSPDYLTQILDGVYNGADPRTYPLSSYSYMIVPTKVEGPTTERKGSTLAAFARYVLCEGQQRAPELGYSPLPMNLVMAASEQIKRIPGAGNAGVDFNQCNNPTFKPGDSPDVNQLAQTAPQPAECDKKGPNQCTTGTAGARDDTPVTGTGSGGSSAEGGGGGGGGAGTTGGGTAGTAGGAAGTAGGTGEIDPETGAFLITSGGGAMATPFTVAPPSWGPSQWLMLAAGVLLLAVIIAPVVRGRDRKRPGDDVPK